MNQTSLRSFKKVEASPSLDSGFSPLIYTEKQIKAEIICLARLWVNDIEVILYSIAPQLRVLEQNFLWGSQYHLLLITLNIQVCGIPNQPSSTPQQKHTE